MRSLFRTIMGLGLLALIAGPAAAQQGRGFGFGGGGNLATLAANTGVQKELKLDDQQVEKAKDLAEKTREKMRETRETLQGLEGEERRTKQQEISREMNASSLKALGEFLKPEQIARLKQISYQVRGVAAFSDPEVQKKLNLTDSQKSDIQAMVQELGTESRTIFQDNQDDREAAMKKIQELGKQTLSKAEAKLNDEQQKSWKELLGAPFEFKPDPRPNN
jgi:pantoate kinase